MLLFLLIVGNFGLGQAVILDLDRIENKITVVRKVGENK
jgi:hypothetical protein